MIGYCDYGVCGVCNAIDLVTVRKFGRLLLCVVCYCDYGACVVAVVL